MDFFKKFKKQLFLRVALAVLFPLIIASSAWIIMTILEVDESIVIGLSLGLGFGFAVFSILILTASIARPFKAYSDIIMYASDRGSSSPPNVETLKLGREMLVAQSMQLYDIASSGENSSSVPVAAGSKIKPEENILNSITMPIIGINHDKVITVANKQTAEYLGRKLEDIIGANLYDVLVLSFSEEQTLKDWLDQSRESAVIASRTWERVRHELDQDNYLQFDLVASFSSGRSDGTETMLAIFDRTERYNQDDKDVGYVALAVHELRTPLTIMRGYIEVFEDELSDQLDPELKDFMRKMQASSEQLAAFVANILKVARVDENQLDLKLREEDIAEVMKHAVSDLELRANVHGKHIELAIAPDLPKVGIDKISIIEVVNNLIDNALKYSGNAEKVRVNVNINQENRVQIDVQDYGIGIPTNVMPNLFRKFHRSYKTNSEITGTGLGLYLSKAIINAHGGNIWVRSKEGEGAIFSFTVLPYDQVSEGEVSGEDGIIRGAHGWIKNHSLYRN